MKGFFSFLILCLFSTTSHAAFKPVSKEESPFFVKKMQISLMEKLKNTHYKNCMMPYDHGFGVLFESENGLHSREFIFTTADAKMLDLPAFYDADANAIMIQQSWIVGTTYSLIAFFENSDDIKDIELKFTFKGDSNFSVKCEL